MKDSKMRNPPDRPELIPLQVSIKEAARLLSYSESTIYAMLARGEIKSIGRHKLRRIPVDELKRWQAERMK